MAKESQTAPLKPLDAILEIVRRMPDHVKRQGNECLVCNPADNGENFAEKWNRPLDGHRYRRAFEEWHENASASVSLGLESFESAEAFAKAVKENFGMGPTFISTVNSEILPIGRCLAARTEPPETPRRWEHCLVVSAEQRALKRM
ncbi:hypothetical protein P4200_08180 [Pseudomonas aeruginosa]|nr:hypothetical protein [Pseudomonas aeruginosa]